MPKIASGSNTRLRISFLAMEIESGEISWFSIENKNIDPLNNLPTDPLKSGKHSYNNIFDSRNKFIGQTLGQEVIEENSVPFTFSEDFMFVQDGKVKGDERASRDNFIAILQGGVFISNEKKYRVLGNAGNINLEAQMLGKNTNRHWKNLYYFENAFLRDGNSYDEKGKAKTIPNPFLSSFSTSNIGLSMEIYIGVGTGETRVLRYPLVAFTNIVTNLDGDVIKIQTQMEIKADPVEATDFFISGGKRDEGKFFEIDDFDFSTGLSAANPYVVNTKAKTNQTFLDIDDVTGEVKLIVNKADKTPITPMEVGTIFYMKKHDTGASQGAGQGLCQASGGVVEKSPVVFVVGQYDCSKPKAWLTKWNYDENVVSNASKALSIFGLKIMDYNENAEDFKLYDSKNL